MQRSKRAPQHHLVHIHRRIPTLLTLLLLYIHHRDSSRHLLQCTLPSYSLLRVSRRVASAQKERGAEGTRARTRSGTCQLLCRADCACARLARFGVGISASSSANVACCVGFPMVRDHVVVTCVRGHCVCVCVCVCVSVCVGVCV